MKQGYGMSRELLQQALMGDYPQLIAAVRQYLAQPAPEPIAWAMLRADGLVLDVICPDEHNDVYEGAYTVPLYAAPQPAPAVPDGWVMVPREPTRDMCVAAVVLNNGNAVYKNVKAEALEIEEQIYAEVYEAMIAAARSAPAGAEPLTDEHIHTLFYPIGTASESQLMVARAIARAIERAHGIGRTT